jgi:hypothetical protein
MSLRTEADDLIDRSKEEIVRAKQRLSRITDQSAVGACRLADDYQARVLEAYLLLIDIERLLDNRDPIKLKPPSRSRCRTA